MQTYHDVLAQHLDPTGTKLAPVSGVLGGTGAYGTKLDWNHGGMLMIVVGTTWDRVSGFYDPSTVLSMRSTTFQGHAARVSTAGGDLVVSARHDDGTIVTLVLSHDFGNNGTSTSDLGLTQQQLLSAAADPRIKLPSYLR